jgi:poly-beta-1,6-N-acetyl-D-glucosamine synthase
MSSPSYIVITPARNEEQNIRHTISSMVQQTVRPTRWVIVNDGSMDNTRAIIDTAAAEISWITTLHRPDRGFRKQGGGVIDAFYDGYHVVASTPWDFLVKFDADLSFDSTYFERCLRKFADEPKLGIGGGTISHELAGHLVCETPDDPSFHVRGATKIYRRACWDAVDGLIRAPGWDTVDELKANMLGWSTRSFPDIPLKHHRMTGAADGSWHNWRKNGIANYVTGYHPLFMLAKCLKRSLKRPYLIGALGLGWGFCLGYIKRMQRVNDDRLVRYVRLQQMNKLFLKPSLW